MNEVLVTTLLIVALFALLGSSVWIGLTLGGVAWIGMQLFSARPAGDAMAVTIWGSASSWTLTALPLFIWMGEILFRTKLSESMFRGLAPWVSWLPGRLLHTNVVGCTVFAAVSGSSAATCATIGKMSLPELGRRGYPEEITIGSLAGAGTLGLLIPPSIIMIVYGVSADVSIAKLFVAGILPGVVLAGLFSGYLVLWSLLHPGRVPVPDQVLSFGQKISESRHLIPVVLLIGAVLGSIYSGVATATEAAAVGVVGALALSAIQGSLNWATFRDSLLGATRLYCMIALILAGAAFLTLSMGYIGLPRNLAEYQLPVGRFIDNPGRVFDVEHDKVLLNQLTLHIERTVDASRREFDVGGHVELLYGADARFLHANGMFDNYEDDDTSRVTGGPQNQFDIPQAYLDFAIPVGNGLRLRVGKFTFFKQHDPNASVFYSHSFTFGAALPFTLTGAYATYAVNDQLSFDAGFSRGWDQSIKDNNDAIDVLGRVRYAVNDQLLLTLAAITGPEQDDDNGNYRSILNATATYRVNDELTLLGDVIYGHQAQPVGGGGDARWYGAAVYGVQSINEYVSAAVRLEWYRDDGGYTTGLDQTLYEGTVGLTIRPFAGDQYLQHLKIRPEVRFDYSNEDYFDGFSRNTQVTAAVDAIYNF